MKTIKQLCPLTIDDCYDFIDLIIEHTMRVDTPEYANFSDSQRELIKKQDGKTIKRIKKLIEMMGEK